MIFDREREYDFSFDPVKGKQASGFLKLSFLESFQYGSKGYIRCTKQFLPTQKNEHDYESAIMALGPTCLENNRW